MTCARDQDQDLDQATDEPMEPVKLNSDQIKLDIKLTEREK